MKTARMVVGIVSIVLFLIVALQSCAAGVGNALSQNGEVSGSAGIFLAICLLVAGIVSVAARSSRGGTITALCFYAFGGLMGICNAGSYSDLKVWSVVSFIFAFILLLTLLKKKPNVIEPQNEMNKGE